MSYRSARSNELTAYQLSRLSGNDYLIVHENNQAESQAGRVVIRKPHNCDHGLSICATRECIESWELDHVLVFDRTAGGRRIRAMIGR